VTGLTVRLDDDRAENLEPDFPASGVLNIGGEPMEFTIYAFKKDKATRYRAREGVIFVVNGQTHGHLPLDFFRHKSVGLSYLDDSLFVTVDCSDISGRAREDLFMNSRDRLRDGELKRAILEELEQTLRTHSGLRALHERRRREQVDERLADSKPLASALEDILRRSPALAGLFLPGTKLTNPFKTFSVMSEPAPYVGKRFPGMFNLKDVPRGSVLRRESSLNARFRIAFETDAENAYFSRDLDRGEFKLFLRLAEDLITFDVGFSINLHDGIATLNGHLPPDALVGDQLSFVAETTDPSRIEPFVNEFVLTVRPEAKRNGGSSTRRKPPSERQGSDRDVPQQLALPEIIPVRESDWPKYEMDKYSALRVKYSGETTGEEPSGSFDFFINVDNIYLRHEEKSRPAIADVLQAQFQYGMVLVGLALLQRYKVSGALKDSDRLIDDMDVEKSVAHMTSAIAPVLLPLIHSLSALEEDL
jgi:hypothetical protein